jgi:hypothetical protein
MSLWFCDLNYAPKDSSSSNLFNVTLGESSRVLIDGWALILLKGNKLAKLAKFIKETSNYYTKIIFKIKSNLINIIIVFIDEYLNYQYLKAYLFILTIMFNLT